MSKNTLLSELINYISANSSGNVVIAAPSSGYALDVTGTGRFTGALTGTSATFTSSVTSSDAFISTDGTNTIRLQKAYFGGIDAIYQTGTNAFGIYLGGGVYTAAKLYITNGGNVGIGTTSPGEILHVSKATYPIIKLTETTASTSAQFGYDSPTLEWRLRTLQAYPLTFGTGDTERMRINGGNGYIGIGTTSPSSPLHVVISSTSSDANNTNTGSTANLYNYFVRQKGASNGISGIQYMLQTFSDAGANGMEIYTQGASSTLVFGTNATERMRITSGGNVLMGATSYAGANPVLEVSTQSAREGISIKCVSGGYSPLFIRGASNQNFFAVNEIGTVLVGVLGTGVVYSNGGNLTSTNPSDSRLKKDIKTITYGLNDILKLRPVSYNWKDDNINQGLQFGFIAQEVQEVMPDAIKEFGDETNFLGLEKDAIYATLVNAIQEQQAQINELKQLLNN